ncbi:MAG: TrmH family RNA methyltransferase [Bacteroidetes bacterium]|nr:MAG: TrmH family RNA methyltransferase [Bacteroidota bacterium]
MSRELVKYLSGFATENRLKRFEEVLLHRTRHLAVVLEDIYQPHNAAAVLRSCDCFGVQDVHVIENQNKFEANPDVELGSAKWITLHRHNQKENNTADCIALLKKNGYKIVVTSPHKNDCSIEELDITHKSALFFGTEMRGVTPVAFEQADAFVKIPMVGFTESLNISVSAAVTLYALVSRLKSSSVNWHLSDQEGMEIRLQWLKNSVPKAELLKKEFLAREM